jgi:hypothetical protein
MSGLLVPPKPWEWQIAFGMNPSFEKPHTRYTTNMTGPAFIFVTHFTPIIKLIPLLNEQVKIWLTGI